MVGNDISQNWIVPDYTKNIFREKRSSYCLVIPVINEGERIKGFLQRVSEAGVPSQLDILIVDGGSTDGSLSECLLKEMNVSALLVKVGPGKLSAQLRCAYAFALEQGYEGVVTIDGNNKDDPAEVTGFIEALKSGVDFAQASRFIRGGVAENTPLSRLFAIRLIHAPLLSLFSGFKWTDTTQGFRAYSRKMLMDPKIAPFRDIFMEYELLAYLSYRVPKLGYLCREIATSRCYPQGKIPTKIKGMQGNLNVLLTLFSACFGRYNP